MFEKLKRCLNKKQQEKNLFDLIEKNSHFLETISEADIVKIFEQFKIYLNIEINNENQKINFNYFYSSFFNQYKSIYIDEYNYLNIEEIYNQNFLYYAEDYNLYAIGKDENTPILIKKDSLKNEIYIEETFSDEELKNDTGLYRNIYYWLVLTIANKNNILLNEEYKLIKQNDS